MFINIKENSCLYVAFVMLNFGALSSLLAYFVKQIPTFVEIFEISDILCIVAGRNLGGDKIKKKVFPNDYLSFSYISPEFVFNMSIVLHVFFTIKKLYKTSGTDIALPFAPVKVVCRKRRPFE